MPEIPLKLWPEAMFPSSMSHPCPFHQFTLYSLSLSLFLSLSLSHSLSLPLLPSLYFFLACESHLLIYMLIHDRSIYLSSSFYLIFMYNNQVPIFLPSSVLAVDIFNCLLINLVVRLSTHLVNVTYLLFLLHLFHSHNHAMIR